MHCSHEAGAGSPRAPGPDVTTKSECSAQSMGLRGDGEVRLAPAVREVGIRCQGGAVGFGQRQLLLCRSLRWACAELRGPSAHQPSAPKPMLPSVPGPPRGKRGARRRTSSRWRWRCCASGAGAAGSRANAEQASPGHVAASRCRRRRVAYRGLHALRVSRGYIALIPEPYWGSPDEPPWQWCIGWGCWLGE